MQPPCLHRLRSLTLYASATPLRGVCPRARGRRGAQPRLRGHGTRRRGRKQRMDAEQILQPVRRNAFAAFRIRFAHRPNNGECAACEQARAGKNSVCGRSVEGESAGFAATTVFGRWRGVSGGYLGRDCRDGESLYSGCGGGGARVWVCVGRESSAFEFAASGRLVFVVCEDT
jgi:hypothetical protein